MKTIKLSIIVPVYNVEKYLHRCINSLLKQELQSYEIILVDDGSTDKSSYICDEYVKKYSNIQVIHKANAGLGMARNSGINVAKGEYLAFVDSDDFLENGYLNRLLNAAIKQEVEVCVAGQFFLDRCGKISTVQCVDPRLWDTKITNAFEIRKISAKVISANEFGEDFCSGSCCFSLYKRNLFIEKHLSFKSEKIFMSEDLAFNMGLFQVCESVYFSSVSGYHYWYNENSLSRGYNEKRFFLLVQTVKEIEKMLDAYKLYGEEYRIALYFWVNYEKCINQEIRYRKIEDINIAKQNMDAMEKNPITQKYLKLLTEKQRLPLKQKILCILLHKKWISLVVVLLRLYNKIKH